MKHRQKGAALIIVLLLFAVLVALAVEVMYRLDHFRTRTGNLLSWDQRYQYAIAAETLAIQALIDDLENDRNNGSLTDDCVSDRWGVALPPMQSLDEANLSPMAQAFYAENRRVANGKAKRVLGWKPAFPTYREGLAAIMARA